MKDSTSRFKLFSLLGIICIIGGWKILSLVMQAGIIFPAPETVFLFFLKQIQKLQFWKHIGISALRVLAGFLLSFACGMMVGVFSGKSKKAYDFFHPFISIVRVIPVLSVIIIVYLWVDSDFVPVVVSFLMAFPIITSTIIEGTRSLDPGLEEFALSYGITGKEKFRSITVPQLFPFIIASVRTSLGLTWKVVIAAEVLSLPLLGIGSSMQNANILLEADEVFSWTVAAVLFSVLFDSIVRLVLQRYDWRIKKGDVRENITSGDKS